MTGSALPQEVVMHKDIKKIVKEIEGNGYTWEQGRSHILIKAKAGKGTLASMPLSPGRGRWEANLRAQLRQRGILGSTR
jgi:hypothetical protein